MKSPSGISPTELTVLKMLWELGPVSLRTLSEELSAQGHSWAYTTVQTLLKRLEEKEAVARDKEQSPHVFRASVSREDLMQTRLGAIAEDLFDGAATPLLYALVEKQNFSSEDMETFRRMLDDKNGTGAVS